MSRGFEAERKHRAVSIPWELLDEVEKFIHEHPEIGYDRLTQFVTDAVRRRLEEVKKLYPS